MDVGCPASAFLFIKRQPPFPRLSSPLPRMCTTTPPGSTLAAPGGSCFFLGGGGSLVWECFDATDVEFVSYFTESRQDSLWGLLRDLESETDMRSRHRGLVSFPAQ